MRRTWYAMSKRASSTQIGRPCSNGTCMIRLRNRGMRCSRDPTSRRVSARRKRPESSKNGAPSKIADGPHVHRRLEPLQVQERRVERTQPVVARHDPDAYREIRAFVRAGWSVRTRTMRPAWWSSWWSVGAVAAWTQVRSPYVRASSSARRSSAAPLTLAVTARVMSPSCCDCGRDLGLVDRLVHERDPLRDLGPILLRRP